MYNIYKSSSDVVTSHHSLIPYSIISLSYLHHHRIAAASPAPIAHDWLPFLAIPFVIAVNTLQSLKKYPQKCLIC